MGHHRLSPGNQEAVKFPERKGPDLASFSPPLSPELDLGNMVRGAGCSPRLSSAGGSHGFPVVEVCIYECAAPSPEPPDPRAAKLGTAPGAQ